MSFWITDITATITILPTFHLLSESALQGLDHYPGDLSIFNFAIAVST
jgi:hypothetical protein